MSANIYADGNRTVVTHNGVESFGFNEDGLSATKMNGGQIGGFRNAIINGAIDISQRGTTFVALANSEYFVDRFQLTDIGAAIVTASQAADAPTGSGFVYSARIATTTAVVTPSAGNLVSIQQYIEGYNIRRFVGRTFTLSFWVRSSKTGVHCIALQNSNLTKSYVAEYTVNSANTWEKKSITVQGGLPTAGTWDYINGKGLIVRWTLMAASDWHSTSDSWLDNQFMSTANQVNAVDNVGNIFAITGVQLELGEVASEFEWRLFQTELAMCQRYYEKSYDLTTAPGTVTGNGAGQERYASATAEYGHDLFKVPKRAAPGITFYSPATGAVGFIRDDSAGADRSVSTNGTSLNRVSWTFTNASTNAACSIHWVANAE